MVDLELEGPVEAEPPPTEESMWSRAADVIQRSIHRATAEELSWVQSLIRKRREHLPLEEGRNDQLEHIAQELDRLGLGQIAFQVRGNIYRVDEDEG